MQKENYFNILNKQIFFTKKNVQPLTPGLLNLTVVTDEDGMAEHSW